jgi:predicted phage terminase large subunit-like protein
MQTLEALRPSAPPRLTRLALALEASLLSESFSDFAKAAWHVLEPRAKLAWDWPLDAICEHLEAVSYGKITHLLMNVPPGCMKSLLAGVFWPAWEWTHPEWRAHRFLGTSHKQDLAIRDNLKCRRLIQSEWYQSRWPLKLTSDQNAKTKFENEDTGFREAMAFTSMTGSRGDRVILDDPLSVDDALSEAELLNAKTTFLESLPTRVNNDASAIVVIMQRLHEEDTAGIILDKKLPYVHLMLPMRFEPERRCATTIGFRDPRKKDGELLFPSRFSEKKVQELELTLGTYAVAGQLQQRPSPRGGGLFKTKYLNLWPAGKDLPDFTFLLQSYDTAFTDDTANDPTACTVWALFYHATIKKKCAMLLDAWDEHMNYPELRKKVIADYKALYGGRKNERGAYDQLHPPRRADLILLEDKGSGISLVQDLRAARLPVHKYNPGKADKWSRAQQALPIYELDLIYIPESTKRPGQPIAWAEAFVRQLTAFGPKITAHDDYVDTFTQAVIYMRDSAMLELPVVEEDEPKEVDYKGKKGNPYAR